MTHQIRALFLAAALTAPLPATHISPTWTSFLFVPQSVAAKVT